MSQEKYSSQLLTLEGHRVEAGEGKEEPTAMNPMKRALTDTLQKEGSKRLFSVTESKKKCFWRSSSCSQGSSAVVSAKCRSRAYVKKGQRCLERLGGRESLICHLTKKY